MSDDTEWIDVGEDDADAALRYALVIEWSPEDDAFVVSVPDIPGLHTHGSTREEAATMGNEAIALWIAGARRTGVSLPPPTFSPLRAYAALEDEAERIRQIRRRLDVSQRDFADMLNVSVSTVRSWEQGLRTPDGASLRLLDIAERQPDVLTNLASERMRRSALTA
jgi:predicted RNase H-like HicB family nuclease